MATTQDYEDFVLGHSAQLSAGTIPKSLWPRLYEKVTSQTFDAGSVFAFCVDEEAPVGQQYSLQTTCAIPALSDLFLIDHLWTFESAADAFTQLRCISSLRSRIRELLELPSVESDESSEDGNGNGNGHGDCEDGSSGDADAAAVEAVMIVKRLWVLTGTYAVDSVTSYYIMDELGSRLTAASPDTAAFQMAVFVNQNTGIAYNVFWPIRDVEEAEEGTCSGLPNGRRKLVALSKILSSDQDWSSSIPDLKTALVGAGYTVAGIAGLLGLPVTAVGLPAQNLSGGPAQAAAAAELPPLGTSLLADYVRFFLLNLPLPESRLSEMLSDAVWEMLEQHGLVYCTNLDVVQEGEEVMWVSLVQVTPVGEDIIVATDFFQLSGSALGFDPVMYIGVDSLGLVAAMPSDLPRRKHVLDLCCGCGIQGLVALSRWAEGATFVDMNPRAVSFTSFNLFLNGFDEERWMVMSGDLYSALEDDTEVVDAIIANPPYIPAGNGAAGLEMFGDGGPDGEDVIRRIVAGAVVHLAHGGFLAIVSNLVNVADYGSKLQQWWAAGLVEQDEAMKAAGKEAMKDGDDPGYEALVLYGVVWDTALYAQLIVGEGDPGQAVKKNYEAGLLDAGVKNVTNGLVFMRVTPDGGPCTASVELGAAQLWQELLSGGPTREGLHGRLLKLLG